MTANRIRGGLVLLGAALIMGAAWSVPAAEAARSRSHAVTGHYAARAIYTGMVQSRTRSYAGRSSYGYGGRLQCVPFARENSGIELTGNAANWWANADGVYERGSRPEVGSVLNFRATGRMRLGHVAVVSKVVDGRTIEIDHANWAGGYGGISRNMRVVDVSERNDWTAVRVELSRGAEFGSVYPTYGFIYDRPDRGTMLANTNPAPPPALAPALTAPRRDMTPLVLSGTPAVEPMEVAEAPDEVRPRMRSTAIRSRTVLIGGPILNLRSLRGGRERELIRVVVPSSRYQVSPRGGMIRLEPVAPRGQRPAVTRVHTRDHVPAAAPRRGARHRT